MSAPERCPATTPKGLRCDLDTGHRADHIWRTWSWPNETDLNICALCGRQFSGLEARVFTINRDEPINLCHPADSTTPMTCYHRWTVYGHRPTKGPS